MHIVYHVNLFLAEYSASMNFTLLHIHLCVGDWVYTCPCVYIYVCMCMCDCVCVCVDVWILPILPIISKVSERISLCAPSSSDMPLAMSCTSVACCSRHCMPRPFHGLLSVTIVLYGRVWSPMHWCEWGIRSLI